MIVSLARALPLVSSLCALAAPTLALHAQAPATPARATASRTVPAAERYRQAELAWDAGNFVAALTELSAILRGPDAAAYRERIALLTGENWHTTLVAEGARAPRWSADGKRAAFETGTGANRTTRIVDVRDGFPTVAEVQGTGVVFSNDGARVAYITGQGAASRVMVRDLAAAREGALALPGLIPAQVVFGADGSMLVVAAATDSVRTRVYRVREGTPPTRVSRTDSVVSDIKLARSGSQLLYGIGGRSPVQQGTGSAFAAGPARAQFGVLDLATGQERVVTGESPVLSASGNAVAYITRRGGTNRVHLTGLGAAGADKEVHSTTGQLTALAITPDGSRVTFQAMPREDWELYTVSAVGGEPERVTREIQHDLLPQWLDDNRLLAVVGEARHRRSYLYTGGRRIRLFHNNTVRTIAPEYEWAPGPDGNRLMIVAERDGDTVTPHRFLWCMDLTREVTTAELIARVDASLAAERKLRVAGERAFAPIMADVRRATADVSTDRVYKYAFDLFQFDSKHVSQPGNAKARTYLTETYRGFGYRDVQAQAFEARAAVNAAGIPTANILAVLPGTTHPELVYVISSHFDSRAQGPGADDNTSGTSVLLETARVLASRPQAATIIFASLTGEESGLLGSREFVRVAKDTKMQLVGVLNNDMVGWANDQRLDNTIRYSNPGIRDLQHAAAIQFSNLITYDAFYYKSTDAQAFYDGYGDVVGGIGSYPVLGNPHYHQPHDVLETINHQLVAEVAKTTIASIMYLASSPSRLAGVAARPATPTAATVEWRASPEKDIARYEVRWGPASEPEKYRQTVTAPRARLENAPAGTVVLVKAVNRRGLEGWDWARGTVSASAGAP
ncbi:MAG: M28 family peptidase [Gemmatimonadota bacterium]